MNIEEEIWIGLLHVKPMSGNDMLQGAMGAFVPVLALANSGQAFSARASALMEAYGFSVIEIEDVELFEDRLKRMKVANDLQIIANKLNADEPVVPGQFEAYQSP